jgi:uncharacterized protein (TIGR03067 family)
LSPWRVLCSWIRHNHKFAQSRQSMWRPLAVATFVCLLALGCDSRPDPAQIQGEWQLWEMNGWFEFDLPTVKGGPTKVIFTDDQFVFMNDVDPKQRVSGTFSCDREKRPREITFRFADRSVVGIYAVSASTLQICFGRDDSIPPATFAGGPDERPALLVFHLLLPE